MWPGLESPVETAPGFAVTFMKSTILLPQNICETGKNWLLERGYALKLGQAIDEATLARDVAGCAAILLRTAHISRRVLEGGAELKVIGRHGVGVDNIDLEAAREMGIRVTNAPESNALPVAEWTLGALLALSHRMVWRDRALRRGDFEVRNRVVGNDLSGKTLAILGLGRIGSLVAQKAALGLGMKIIALARAPKPVDGWIETVETREELFARADFVSLHLPLSPQTRRSIGARELGWMKASAHLINAARGEIVDETALLDALRSGEIAGAALDVFETEPLLPDHPLFALDNVILTPHSAALTQEAMERMALDAARGIDDVLSGRAPQWPVDAPENAP